MEKKPLVLVGRFTKPYGLKGQIKVQWYIDTMEDLLSFGHFFIENKKAPGGYKEVFFAELKEYQKAYVAKVTDVDDRESAESLTGKPIYVYEDAFPALPPGQYYIKDILGCEVLYEGNLFGVVENFFEVGSQNMFVIKMANGKVLAVPYMPRYILRVDVVRKQVEAGHLAELL